MSSIRALKKNARKQLKSHVLVGFWIGLLMILFFLIPYLKIIVIPLMISGFSYYYLMVSRGTPTSAKTFFLYYDGSEKVYLLNFLFTLIYIAPVFILVAILKSGILTIPAQGYFLLSILIALSPRFLLYPYRQATYILIDHPKISLIQALNESKLIMYGNKKRLFLLDSIYSLKITLLFTASTSVVKMIVIGVVSSECSRKLT